MQFQVVGYVLVERNRERAPAQSPAEEELWRGEDAESDDPLARALAAPIDTERLFVDSVRALVDGLLAGAPGDTGDGVVGRGPYSQ